MIRIMVDSASDCSGSSSDITVVPIEITLGGRQYRDGVDIDADRFYELLTSGSDFPKTSQPSPQTFAAIFEEVRQAGDEIVYICLSSALSGTCQSACIARQMVGAEGIYVVDSLTASHAIGLLARHALSLREQGMSALSIAAELEQLKARVKVIAVVDTLEYLYRGGRLSRASALLGSAANVKPVLSISADGTVTSIGKCLGKLKAMQFLLRQVESARPDPGFPVYSLYSCGEENCAALERVLAEAGFAPEKRCQIGPTIGAHTGPGVCGVIFVAQA